MAEKKKILYIVEAMGGGVFTYIVDLANELVNKYDMYIAYAVRKQTPKNYKDYFDKRIHLIEVKNFGRAINLLIKRPNGEDKNNFEKVIQNNEDIEEKAEFNGSIALLCLNNCNSGFSKQQYALYYVRRCNFYCLH